MTGARGLRGSRGVPRVRGHRLGLVIGVVVLLARGSARCDGAQPRLSAQVKTWMQKTLRLMAPRTTIAPWADGALCLSRIYFS